MSHNLGKQMKSSGFIGSYSPEERQRRIERFIMKRKHRKWEKKVKYDVRKVPISKISSYSLLISIMILEEFCR